MSKLKLLGKTEAEAVAEIEAIGMKARVYSRDGRKLDPFDQSFSLNRVNINIMDGKVSSAFVR